MSGTNNSDDGGTDENTILQYEDANQPFRFGRGVGSTLELNVPRHNGDPASTNALLDDSRRKMRNKGQRPIAIGEHTHRDRTHGDITVRRVFSISKTALIEFVRVTREIPTAPDYKTDTTPESEGAMSSEVFAGYKLHEFSDNAGMVEAAEGDIPIEVLISKQHTANPVRDLRRDYAEWVEDGYADIRSLDEETLGRHSDFADEVKNDRSLITHATT